MNRKEENLNPIHIEFGAWLREKLDTSGLKYNVVAEAAGIDPVQLSRILSGESGTKPAVVIALAERIGIDPGEALEWAGFSRRLYRGWDLSHEISRLMKSLTPERQLDIVEFARFWHSRFTSEEPIRPLNNEAVPIGEILRQVKSPEERKKA